MPPRQGKSCNVSQCRNSRQPWQRQLHFVFPGSGGYSFQVKLDAAICHVSVIPHPVKQHNEILCFYKPFCCPLRAWSVGPTSRLRRVHLLPTPVLIAGAGPRANRCDGMHIYVQARDFRAAWLSSRCSASTLLRSGNGHGRWRCRARAATMPAWCASAYVHGEAAVAANALPFARF